MSTNPTLNVQGGIPQLQDESLRVPFPLFNAFRPFVMEEFTRRKTTFPTPMVSPFVKLTSCMEDPTKRYKFFTLGLHGFNNSDIDIFDLSYGSARELVGYAYDLDNRNPDGSLKVRLISSDELTPLQLTDAERRALGAEEVSAIQNEVSASFQSVSQTLYARGAHPVPGITNVQIRRQGLKTAFKAYVNWVCYNRAQLEFLRNHFLTIPNNVVLEWGNVFSDKRLLKTLDFSNDNVLNDLFNSVIRGRAYTIDNWCKPNNGNYDNMVGRVGNYQINLDAQTQTYTCMTEIISVSEELWGLNSYWTGFVVGGDPVAIQSQRITTIHDYFKIGGPYDVLVNQYSDPSSNPDATKYVVAHFSNWDKSNKNINQNFASLGNFSTNPEDYRFISWEFFTTKVLPNIFALVDSKNTQDDLYRIGNLFDKNTDLNKAIWVGDNQYLRSTNPDIMLLVKKNMNGIPSVFTGAGYFDQDGNGYRGRLKNGVWLNVGMVRQAFLGTDNFQAALEKIVENLNNATGNYWNLILYWDAENGTYSIVDYKYEDYNVPTLYKFNVGALGELLDIKLDSAFPKEIVAQLLLFAHFKTDSPADQFKQLQNLPFIGTTAYYGFAVNWTNLNDLLEQKLSQATRTLVKSDATDATSVALGSAPDKVDNIRNILGLVPVGPDSHGGALVTSKNPPPGRKLAPDEIIAQNAFGRDGTAVNDIRNSPFPVNTPTDPTKVFKSLTNPNIDPEFKTRLLQLIQDIQNLGLTVNVTETYRTQDRQNYLYNIGRNGNPGPIVTDTLHSYHTTGKAADLIILQNGTNITSQFRPTLGIMASNVGLECIGSEVPTVGSFFDPGHVQLPSPNGNGMGDGSGNLAINGSETADGQPLPDVGTQAAQNEQTLEQTKQGIIVRFGNEILSMIEPSPSAMSNKIVTDGYKNWPHSNNFINPFPATTKVAVTTMGIGGISITDGFYVDKLPFLFERHGAFQVLDIKEFIDTNGWKTEISGHFKLLWLDGNGQPNQPIDHLLTNK